MALTFYLFILYIKISRHYLKNIFNKLSKNPKVDPLWFLTITSLTEYPEDMITKIRFVNKLAGYVFFKNMSKRMREIYLVLSSTLAPEELKILHLYDTLGVIDFVLLVIVGVLNFFF